MSRPVLCLLVCLLALGSSTGRAAAHRPTDQPHQLYQMGDLALESGQVVKDFSISLDFLIGPGRALDPTKYFIVCTDAIGNGLTTSPSNSKAQARMQFPRFTIRDMVQSQHRLLKEKLGIDHVVAVIVTQRGAKLR